MSTKVIEDIVSFIQEEAERFGAKVKDEFKKDYVFRKNIGSETLKNGGAYFGFVHADEENTGPYHDFSFNIYPSDKEGESWLISLGIGLLGFKDDYKLALTPGLRRLFYPLTTTNGFCKSDFSDIETALPKNFRDKLKHIDNTIKRYTSVLPACRILENPTSKDDKKIISAFLAAYAQLREWPTNKDHRKAISNALKPYSGTTRSSNQVEQEIEDLLEKRKYVLLQGAPGTGKTHLAKKIGTKRGKVIFTQFHAETTYSDFIYGIRPNLKANNLQYESTTGPFVEAIEYAENNLDKSVVLIIDEINRANLSNILGPIFYLFEYKMDANNVEIELYPGKTISILPQNLYVIGTMNTADRSLAVVDFALRRRFAWYTMKPIRLTNNLSNNKDFHEEDFHFFDETFNWYATYEELQLQPGQGYFIAPDEETMKLRIQYELLPLIREYLIEGYLASAKETLNNYFIDRIQQQIFE